MPEKSATLSDTGAAGNLWTDVYTYDARGNLTSHTDARGIKAVVSGDDPLDRVHLISYDMSGFTDTSHPVAECPEVAFTFEKTGDLRRVALEMVGDTYAQTYTYDPVSGLTETSSTMAGVSDGPLTYTYAHDELGRVTATTYPARYGQPYAPRPVVWCQYGVGGAVTTVVVDSTPLAAAVHYDAAGNLSRLTAGPDGLGQTDEEYDWNSWFGVMKSQLLIRNHDTQLVNLEYGYASPAGTQPGITGQVTSVTDHVTAENSLQYGYDALGRLTSVAGGASSGGSAWTQTYTYDRYGNRLDVTATGIVGHLVQPVPVDGESSLIVDTGTNHVSQTGWAYDAAGNLVERPDPDTGLPVRFRYDAAGRLTTVADGAGTVLAEHVYGVCHRRRATHPQPAERVCCTPGTATK